MGEVFILLIGLCHGGEPMQGYARACYDWRRVSQHDGLEACTRARVAEQYRRPAATRGPLICTAQHKAPQ